MKRRGSAYRLSGIPLRGDARGGDCWLRDGRCDEDARISGTGGWVSVGVGSSSRRGMAGTGVRGVVRAMGDGVEMVEKDYRDERLSGELPAEGVQGRRFALPVPVRGRDQLQALLRRQWLHKVWIRIPSSSSSILSLSTGLLNSTLRNRILLPCTLFFFLLTCEIVAFLLPPPHMKFRARNVRDFIRMQASHDQSRSTLCASNCRRRHH